MPITKKEKRGGIVIYHVSKKYTDDEMESLKNTYVQQDNIDLVIRDHDADVYSADDGKLLLKFRKNVLTPRHIRLFYDNVINFAKNKSTNRGSTSGSNKKNVGDNPKIMTNILGYFDRLSPNQKYILKRQGKTLSMPVRETRFNMDHPDKFAKLVPLIREIDREYKKYVPEKYKLQCKKANQTPFRIPGTCFTTITTNLNFQTTMHRDSGDDAEGFGNLVVIEDGKYSGAETCFPQYGVGVDVRTGDVLLMDVHQLHGNTKMVSETKDAKRLSIVCYLRYDIWKHTKHMTRKQMIKHNKTIRGLRRVK
jgi:hypothetical protein